MNKKLIAMALALLVATPAFCEERDTLLKGNVTHGGFGGPEIRFTQIDGKGNALIGGKGAWLVNHQYYLGGAGFGAVKKFGNEDLSLGYGGLLMGYIFPSQKLFTYSVELLAGAGGISRNDNVASYGNHQEDTIIVFEPAVYAQLNLTKFANINAGISYRTIGDSNTSGLSNSDLSGLSANINIVFGAF